MTPTGFENAIPILRVENLASSLDYYVNALGFKVDWNDPGMASVSRDHSVIMLCEGEQGNSGTWIWVGVEDVAALFEEYKAQGARISMEPVNYNWAYEMRVEDLDGHILRLGSEPRQDIPTVQAG